VSVVVYCDSSVLLKRVLTESDSHSVRAILDQHLAAESILITSELAAVEVRRALGRLALGSLAGTTVDAIADQVFEGVSTVAVNHDVLFAAGRLPGPHLGSLDAIHVATAVLSEAGVVITRDERMRQACADVGIAVA